MPEHFFTMARNQIAHHWPGREQECNGGYVVVEAPDTATAREMMNTAFDAKWAFQYTELDQIHPMDQNLLHMLPGEGICQHFMVIRTGLRFTRGICGEKLPCSMHEVKP